jgi:hypothetical protein
VNPRLVRGAGLFVVLCGGILGLTAARLESQPPAADKTPDKSPTLRAERTEATLAVLKEQVDRIREDVRGTQNHLASIQARFDALGQTYYPRSEAEQVRKLDATPERVASLSARLDALEGRVNGYGDKLIGYALAGGLGIAGGAGALAYLKKNPTVPPGYTYQTQRSEVVAPQGRLEPHGPENPGPPPAGT